MNRIFWNGNESHSRNLGVPPAGMAVAHDRQSPPSAPSQDQRAYESYVRYSRAIGAPALDFSTWYRKDSGIGGSLYSNYLQFHGMSIKDVGRQDRSILRGKAPSYQPAWSGIWDNAVKLVEG